MTSAWRNIVRDRLILPHCPFYRRYPFSSPIRISAADKRGCIDFELGFFYNRIPKAANSTVVLNLAEQKPSWNPESEAAKRLFRRPSSLSSREMRHFDSLYRFTFVRNPYVRTLSAYLDKVHRNSRDGDGGTPISFMEFLRRLDCGMLYDNPHWAPQTSLMVLPVCEYDFIGRVETFEQDLATVLATIRGEPYKGDMHAARGNWTGAVERVMEYYDDDARRLVRRLYARDFSALGYAAE